MDIRQGYVRTTTRRMSFLEKPITTIPLKAAVSDLAGEKFAAPPPQSVVVDECILDVEDLPGQLNREFASVRVSLCADISKPWYVPRRPGAHRPLIPPEAIDTVQPQDGGRVLAGKEIQELG